MSDLKGISESLHKLAEELSERFRARCLRLSELSTNSRRGKVGLSSAGGCLRQLGYKLSGRNGRPWGWRQFITLDDGHSAHKQFRKILVQALRRDTHLKLDLQEAECYIKVGHNNVVGHIDGVIKRICGGDCEAHQGYPWESILEIKTTSDFGFRAWKSGGIPSSYKAQATAYMMGMEINSTLFWVKNKSSGDFIMVPFIYDEQLGEEVRRRLVRPFNERRGEDIPRGFMPGKLGKLPWECGYCAYVKRCWSRCGLEKQGTGKYTVDLERSYPEVSKGKVMDLKRGLLEETEDAKLDINRDGQEERHDQEGDRDGVPETRGS